MPGSKALPPNTSANSLLSTNAAGRPSSSTSSGQTAKVAGAATGVGMTADHAAPITVLSCDNLLANGEHTGRLVREFVAALPAVERDELLPWLDAAVTFPNGMVDRIVPATTDAYRAAAAAHLGATDAIPVPAEPFTMWVLEDRFAPSSWVWRKLVGRRDVEGVR